MPHAHIIEMDVHEVVIEIEIWVVLHFLAIVDRVEEEEAIQMADFDDMEVGTKM